MAAGRLCQHRCRAGRQTGSGPRAGRADDSTPRAACDHAHARANADAFLERLAGYGIRLTCVFGGFEGESYADIPTVARTVGLVPPATRAAQTKELKEISDFAKLLGCTAVGLHIGFVPHDRSLPLYQEVDRGGARRVRSLCRQRPGPAPRDRAGDGRRPAGVHSGCRAQTTCSSTSTRPT